MPKLKLPQPKIKLVLLLLPQVQDMELLGWLSAASSAAAAAAAAGSSLCALPHMGDGGGGDARPLASKKLFPLLEPKIRALQKNWARKKRKLKFLKISFFLWFSK